jgi:hypothetical protein
MFVQVAAFPDVQHSASRDVVLRGNGRPHAAHSWSYDINQEQKWLFRTNGNDQAELRPPHS